MCISKNFIHIGVVPGVIPSPGATGVNQASCPTWLERVGSRVRIRSCQNRSWRAAASDGWSGRLHHCRPSPTSNFQHPWRASYQRSSNRSWWMHHWRTYQPQIHIARPFLVKILRARRSSSHGPGEGRSAGFSHLRTVVPSRPRWSSLYLCPLGHLHRDRLFLVDWNSVLSSALTQGSHRGIWGGLIWPGSSLSAGLSHRHLSGPLRQGRRTQYLFWLIHLHGQETTALRLFRRPTVLVQHPLSLLWSEWHR